MEENSSLIALDPNPKMVGEHGNRFPDFDTIDRIFSRLGFNFAIAISVGSNHTGTYETEIWHLTIFLLIIGGCSLDLDVQVNLPVVIEPQHANIHCEPPVNPLADIELLF